MRVGIRQAVDGDIDIFVDFAVKLSKYNRNNHNSECKYDNYEFVINSVKGKAQDTFRNRNEDTLILIAEIEGNPVGYALGSIYEEDETADNGTGRIGLFDELFLDDAARGFGLGQKLLDETMEWMKEKGVNRVKLHAYSWNNNARKLYEHKGFREYVVSYEKFI